MYFISLWFKYAYAYFTWQIKTGDFAPKMSFPSVSDTCTVFATSILTLGHIKKIWLPRVVVSENDHMFRPSVCWKTPVYFNAFQSEPPVANDIVDTTLPPRQSRSVCQWPAKRSSPVLIKYHGAEQWSFSHWRFWPFSAILREMPNFGPI